MVLDRRRALQAVATTAATALAGCTSSPFGAGGPAREYTLHVDPIDATPVEHALYEPSDDALFGDPARTALDAVLPEGRHTTYGYRPLPDDAYVTHEGRYYGIEHVVTGRAARERTLVRLDPLPDDESAPADAVLVDSLDRPDARVVKILHSHAQTDGEGSAADLLRGDAYVLRRPVEREGRLAAGDLDGRVVTMTGGGSWGYRVRTARESIRETAHTAFAVEVADSRAAFREVVFASRIDAELSPSALAADARERLTTAVDTGQYAETTPLSPAFEALLDALGLRDVESLSNGNLLWYDGGFYRYALYVDDDPG